MSQQREADSFVMMYTPSESATLFATFDSLELVEGCWVINGEEQTRVETEEDAEEEAALEPGPFDTWIEAGFMTRTSCPYCGAAFDRDVCLKTTDGRIVDLCEIANPHADATGSYEMFSCPQCAFWQFYGGEDYATLAAASIVRTFEESLPEGCRAELAQALLRSPQRWHELSPRQLERLIADVFRANYSQADVIHVGRPGDRGVDVVFVDAEHRQWLIQVKGRREAKAVEPFETLLKLLGTLSLKDNKYGIIATTADHFSYHADMEARAMAKRGIRIELIDRGKLARMIKALLPNRAWSSLIQSLSDDLSVPLGERFAQKFADTRQMSLFEQLNIRL